MRKVLIVMLLAMGAIAMTSCSQDKEAVQPPAEPVQDLVYAIGFTNMSQIPTITSYEGVKPAK